MTKLTKGSSLAIVLLVYIAAFFVGLFAYQIVFNWAHRMLLSFFVADVAATILVWLAGLIFRNASMYDPYWSVAPIVLMLGFLSAMAPNFNALNIISILYLIVFACWGVRLTANWVIGWRGMDHQDWRYTMLRENNPKLWPLTNFFGINMMPTLIVFAGILPAYYATLHGKDASIITYLGVIVCLFAATLQIVSDTQMLSFRNQKQKAGKNMTEGLWRYSRHPNYFGEVSFWWGIWLMQLGVLPAYWWTVFAPVFMTLLFIFISIPMMEKRLIATKEGYPNYIKNTSMLLPLPKKL